LNAVVLSVDARDLPQIARDTAITRVVGVANYSQDLSETVPYIGGETAHSLGAKGKGVRVAVIDSGVDYTHAALSGPGTQAAYEAAWAPIPRVSQVGFDLRRLPGGRRPPQRRTTACSKLQIVGGYDFVGSAGLTTHRRAESPSSNRIRIRSRHRTRPLSAHGTHVSDIIAGKLGVRRTRRSTR
jgi:subtilisin family serine protease